MSPSQGLRRIVRERGVEPLRTERKYPILSPRVHLTCTSVVSMARTRRAFGTLRRLPSDRYQASYIGPDGQRHRAPSTYLLRSDAEAWLRDEEIAIDRGTWIAPSVRAPEVAAVTLAAYCADIIARRQRRARKPLRDSTAALYRRLVQQVIAPTLGRIAVSQISPEAVRAWYDALPAATATQNGNAYQLLRSILSDAVEDGLIPTNPCRIRGAGKPAPAHRSVALSPTELRTYLAAVPDRWRVILAITAWGALRSGEVRALRRCDISDDATTIRVERTAARISDPDGGRRWHIGPPKTTAGIRTAHLPPSIAEGIAQWLADWDAHHPDATGDELLFPARGGGPLSDGSIYRAHQRGARAVGRPGMSVHDLRKTGATLAAQSGATVRELMARLGHTTPGMAMLYQVATDERDRAIAQRMGELG